ncbi:MAG: peptidylprolyl isomerase [Eubacterium sp.]|nr:peptidylprolyl isomerase [Eubacterium sp.]
MSDKNIKNAPMNENEAKSTVEENAAKTEVLFDEEPTETSAEPAEESAYDPENPTYEENDNWEFEAEALTLKNTVIEGDELEVELPEKPVAQTRERPKAVQPVAAPTVQKVNTDNKNVTKFLITAIIAVLVIGVLTFFGIRYYTVPNTSEKMNPGNVAMTVGDQKISLGMYNYYYKSVVNSIKSNAMYGYYPDLDIYTDFNQQETTDDDGNTMTWAERFDKEAQDQIQMIAAFYEMALENGVTLTEDQQEQITSTMTELESAAVADGKSVDEYISENYGDYCGYATLEKMITMSMVAQNYYVMQSASIAPTEAEIEAYADEHISEYLTADIAYLVIPYDETTHDTVMASAEEYAAGFTTAEDLIAAIPTACADLIQSYVDMGYYASAEAGAEDLATQVELTLSQEYVSNGFPSEVYDWVMSAEAAIGSCKAFDVADNGFALIVLKETEATPDEETVFTVRHILIQPETETEEVTDETTGETTEQALPATEEQLAAAKTKADEVYAEYQNGDKTELSFAKLAEEYSEDPGSTLEQSGVYGGIYENIAASENFAEEFKAWALDPARQYGDTDIVETQFGYHIMYFVYSGPKYLGQARTSLCVEMQDGAADDYATKLYDSVLAKRTPAAPETAADTTGEIAE